MKGLMAALACFCALAAHAVIPENGWWWASNESGRGFNLEIQDKTLFFATFAYEANGAPTWLVSSGAMTSDRDYSGTLLKASGGQCFGCAYVAPSFNNAGTMTLHFTSSQTGVITINGISISVKRFDFWQNELIPDAMMGEWSMVIGDSSFPVYEAERVVFYSKQSGSSGVFLGGNRLGSSNNLAVVSYSASASSYSILLDSSTSFYRFFRFNTTGFNRLEGQFWIFDKSAQPTGAGTFFQGHRTASGSYVQTGIGPASSKMLDTEALQRGLERDISLAAGFGKHAPGTTVSPEVLSDFEALKATLEGLR